MNAIQLLLLIEYSEGWKDELEMNLMEAQSPLFSQDSRNDLIEGIKKLDELTSKCKEDLLKIEEKIKG